MAKNLISVEELRARLAEDRATRLVDVRELAEFSRERIPGAECVPLTALNEWLMSVRRDESVVFVCQTGVRSLQATTLAATLGYRETASLSGGVESWRAAGHAVESVESMGMEDAT